MQTYNLETHMNWFKHLTDMHEHPDLVEAEKQEKHIAYKAYFIILEIYGKYYNELDGDDYLRMNITILKRKIGISERKLMKLLTIFKKNLINLKSDEEMILIKLPQYAELASNWTKRNNSKNKNASVAPAAHRIELNGIEEECTTTVYNHEHAFEIFWNIYPKKVNKAKTKDFWMKVIDNNEKLFHKILESLKYQITEKYINLKDNMKFCPFPLNWLKNKRYEDISIEIIKENISATPGRDGFPINEFGNDKRVSFGNDGNVKTIKREKAKLKNNVGEKEKTIWLKIKEHIKSQINEHSYSSFIEPLELIRIEKNKHIIETPEDIKIWVEEHYVKTIEEHFVELLKKEVTIVLH